MAKPKLCLIPSAVGDGALYSVLPSSGVGDFDFSRNGSTATRVNAQGLIETVDADVPRLNYPLIDGIVSGCPSVLLEPQRRNLVTYSEDFSNAVWVKTPSLVTVTSNQFISPDGTQNADRLQVQATSSLALCSHLVSHTLNEKITVSAWVKSNTNSIEKIKLFGDYGTANSISDEFLVTNTWQRIEFTFTPTATGNRNVGFYNVSNLSSDIQIYGFQAEQGSYPTSYIPTSGQVDGVSRPAETCNNSGDANTFNDSEGVLFFEGSFIDNGVLAHVITISDGSNANVLFIGWTSSTSSFRVIVKSNSVPTCNLIITEVDVLDINKIALVYSNQNFELYSNGFLITSSNGINGGNTPLTLSTLQFDENGINKFYGNTKQLQYFDTALTDSELETLTSWVSFSDMAEGQQYIIE